MRTIARYLRNGLAAVGAASILVFFLQNLASHHECYSAAETKALADLRGIASLVELYFQDHGFYPERVEDLVGTYMDKAPLNPWGGEYRLEEREGRIYVYTYTLDSGPKDYEYRIEYGI